MFEHLIKAIETLKVESELDYKTNPDYLENKFVTEDGFKIGYYISKKKLKWYLVLERYGSDNTVFINDVIKLETAFIDAKAKMEELKQL